MSETTVENCESEPIHVPECVQPHGVMFVLRGAQLKVSRVSESCEAHLGWPAERFIGQPIEALLTPKTFERLTTCLRATPALRVSDFQARFAFNEASFCGLLHRNVDGEIILEIEPDTERVPLSYESLQRTLHALLSRFHETEGIDDLGRAIAEEVRGLTGFDRVMVYRFDADENGQIISESLAEGQQPYLGWRYPASDIPEQARRLYEKNWLRCISDASYEPSPLLPPSDAPLDMAHSTLRSVSPVHRRYMINMGSLATMSISLLNAEGGLWGLIACHNRSPLLIPYRIRVACSFMGQILSWQLQARTRSEGLAARAALRARLARVIDAIAGGAERVGQIATAIDEFAGLFESSGMCLVNGAQVVSRGMVPDSTVIMGLRGLAQAHGEEGVFATDCVSRFEPAWTVQSNVLAGVLALELEANKTWLFWFRPQQVRSLSWGGNPHLKKLVTQFDGVDRLSPRGSFDLWRETVQHVAEPWTEAEVGTAQDLLRSLQDMSARRARELERLTRQLKAANTSKDEFLAMVSHELRTPLNAISGWVKLLRSGRLRPDQQTQALEVIERNTNAQVQIISDLLDISRVISGRLKLELTEVDPLERIEKAVDSLRPMADAAQVRLFLALDPQAGPIIADADRIQQIVFNLLSNAIKYTPAGGRVRVTLRRVSSMVEIIVSDNGMGFSAQERSQLFASFEQGAAGRDSRGGLGLRLSIVRRLIELHGGGIDAVSPGAGKGATFTVRLPVAPIATEPPEVAEETEAAEDDAYADLAGMRMLIVEDEPDSRSMLSALLEGYGVDVIACPDGPSALEALERATAVRCIISDIGLPRMSGYEFLETLRRRTPDQGSELPAIALTAYARAQDRTRAYRAGFQAHVAKPVDPNELLAMLVSMLRRPAVL